MAAYIVGAYLAYISALVTLIRTGGDFAAAGIALGAGIVSAAVGAGIGAGISAVTSGATQAAIETSLQLAGLVSGIRGLADGDYAAIIGIGLSVAAIASAYGGSPSTTFSEDTNPDLPTIDEVGPNEEAANLRPLEKAAIKELDSLRAKNDKLEHGIKARQDGGFDHFTASEDAPGNVDIPEFWESELWGHTHVNNLTAPSIYDNLAFNNANQAGLLKPGQQMLIVKPDGTVRSVRIGPNGEESMKHCAAPGTTSIPGGGSTQKPWLFVLLSRAFALPFILACSSIGPQIGPHLGGVPLVRILAVPAQFDDRQVSVLGILKNADGILMLYASYADAHHSAMLNGVRVQPEDPGERARMSADSELEVYALVTGLYQAPDSTTQAVWIGVLNNAKILPFDQFGHSPD